MPIHKVYITTVEDDVIAYRSCDKTNGIFYAKVKGDQYFGVSRTYSLKEIENKYYIPWDRITCEACILLRLND